MAIANDLTMTGKCLLMSKELVGFSRGPATLYDLQLASLPAGSLSSPLGAETIAVKKSGIAFT